MKAALLILFLFWTSATSELSGDRLIIWNVGQGLWTTIVSLDSCTHIDMGGEKIDWKKLTRACGSKKLNAAAFSHWDLDHINFAERASRTLSGFCLAIPPRGPTTPEKRKVFSRFQRCDHHYSKHFAREITEIVFSPVINSKKKTTNDYSRIFTSKTTLFPGDSTAKQERIWSQIILPQHLKYLVLGHHGSQTSSSTKLLQRLPELRLAIASARKKRYGHPHRSVVKRLRLRGISSIETEQWNNIVIELR